MTSFPLAAASRGKTPHEELLATARAFDLAGPQIPPVVQNPPKKRTLPSSFTGSAEVMRAAEESRKNRPPLRYEGEILYARNETECKKACLRLEKSLEDLAVPITIDDAAASSKSTSSNSCNAVETTNGATANAAEEETALPMTWSVMGLDVEWRVIRLKNRPPRRIATLQLSSKDTAVVFQMHKIGCIPESLRKLLERQDIIKVGVGIKADCTKITRDWPLKALTAAASESPSKKGGASPKTKAVSSKKAQQQQEPSSFLPSSSSPEKEQGKQEDALLAGAAAAAEEAAAAAAAAGAKGQQQQEQQQQQQQEHQQQQQEATSSSSAAAAAEPNERSVSVTPEVTPEPGEYCRTTSILDLKEVVGTACAGTADSKPTKGTLQVLCEEWLNQTLAKPEGIRMGNWEASPLSDEQLTYAATDAWAGVLIFEAARRRNPLLVDELMKLTAHGLRGATSAYPTQGPPPKHSTSRSPKEKARIAAEKEDRRLLALTAEGVERPGRDSEHVFPALPNAETITKRKLEAHTLLMERGLTVDSIAAIQGIKASTLQSYLADAVAAGHSYSLEALNITQDNVFAVEEAAADVGLSFMNIHEHLGTTTTLTIPDLRLVIAHIRRQRMSAGGG
eukprot:CAMPEP_0206433912 /NCGR_PEP_ID=MMETSP0324_2-20121206/8805_1 /ASSEMBLY_ACC=CAM_ASM_000836 /TAXON_ID=2866 /ORGANISM="Crypthecodinium cohnii, Strain Seligo" /LENGTH=621 /DNA_ID=CAMNT_0053900247 /DNA_START=343 /DNA_END=2204 /DNA_ORIENTATION=-